MIILDTNVVSEPLKPRPNAAVSTWLDKQVAESLFLTAISLAELLTGIEGLPEGRRKRELDADTRTLLDQLFGPRILPFDKPAATAYTKLKNKTRSAGQALSLGDGQIAAIAHTYGFAVATRDTAPFEAAGVQVINPWTTQNTL